MRYGVLFNSFRSALHQTMAGLTDSMINTIVYTHWPTTLKRTLAGTKVTAEERKRVDQLCLFLAMISNSNFRFYSDEGKRMIVNAIKVRLEHIASGGVTS